MNYACRSNRSFVSSKPMNQKTSGCLTPQMKERWKYFDTHAVSVSVDPSTNETTVKVVKVDGSRK